jgi:hypothetical protein
MREKTYLITYKPAVRWSYVIKNPLNEYDLANMESTTLVPNNKVKTIEITASNKEMAKAMLAVREFSYNMCEGYGDTIAKSAYKGIISIEEVTDKE